MFIQLFLLLFLQDHNSSISHRTYKTINFNSFFFQTLSITLTVFPISEEQSVML